MVERKQLGPKDGRGDQGRPRRRQVLGDADQSQTERAPETERVWRSAREEEPIDAEVIDDGRGAPWEKSREYWARAKESARSFFGANTHEKIHEREQARQRDEQRANEADDPEADHREQLLRLRAMARTANEQYMASLRESNLLTPGFEDEDEKKLRDPDTDRLEAMRMVYTQMMVQSCVRPLSRGVNAQSVIQAVGMMTAMTVLSPNFREEVKDQLEPLKQKFRDRIDRKAREQYDSAAGDVAQRSQMFANETNVGRRSRLIGTVDPRERLSKKWQKRYDDLQRRERGNRELYTAESAALTEVGLMESAFWKLREEGSNHVEIKQSYKAMLAHVRGQFDDDGLDRADVVERVKLLAGARMEAEPELRSMFVGISHGFIQQGSTVDERSGKERWNGQFETCTGGSVPDEGLFILRIPQGPDDHARAMTETMRQSISQAVHRKDGSGVREGVFGYMVGFAGRQQGIDSSNFPSMARSETMLASMELDGISAQEQQRAYSMAYANAMDAVAREHPDFGAELNRTLGPDWQDKLQEAVDDPAGFVAYERARPRAREHGSGRSHDPGSQQSEPDADQQYQPA